MILSVYRNFEKDSNYAKVLGYLGALSNIMLSLPYNVKYLKVT